MSPYIETFSNHLVHGFVDILSLHETVSSSANVYEVVNEQHLAVTRFYCKKAQMA